MLQVLIFAPYIALASSFVLAGTVLVICCTRRTEPLAAEGFTVRSNKRAVARAAKRAQAPAAPDREPNRAWQTAAA